MSWLSKLTRSWRNSHSEEYSPWTSTEGLYVLVLFGTTLRRRPSYCHYLYPINFYYITRWYKFARVTYQL